MYIQNCEGSLLLAGHFRTNHLQLSASEGDVAKQNTIINEHPIAYVFLSLTSEKKHYFTFLFQNKFLKKIFLLRGISKIMKEGLNELRKEGRKRMEGRKGKKENDQ